MSEPTTASPAGGWPQVPRRITLRNSMKAARDPIGALNQLLAHYGDTVRLYLGGVRPAIVTRDPALVQHILQKNHRRYFKSDLTHGLLRYLGRGLLTNEGADWLRQRRLIQPGFHRQRLAGLTRLMRAAADEWVAELDALTAASPVAELDAHAAMTRVAFRIVARSVFGDSLDDSQLAQLSDWLTAIQAFYVNTIRQPYLRPWHWVRGNYSRHDRLARQLRELVQAAVGRHRAAQAASPPGTPAPDDLLQMLLDARYEDTGEAMPDEQLLDELNILLVAGHETSANALAWALYLLAHHPAAQDKLVAEIAHELPGGRPPEFADLPRLPYALQVVQEAMRLYPPAWIMDRVATEPDEFQGQPIPKGTLFSLYLYGLHHHPALWPDAEAFRPERFAAGAQPPPPAYGYLPFGSGPRLCVGQQFALTELQLVLVQTLRRYGVEPAGTAVPSMSPLITLRPGGALPLGFRRRPE
ncbi:cytochrome P450 [Hymenobacter ginsengisoli]|uniref:Cytochrome P450 n=1 Tax=Hymenobacter ginsengisoli TaxID=1051626 RepID=A0ABP8QNA3_9BACT|nr:MULTISPECIES: cytochrome P450 [unclassified Hymenobacter]MBO2032747.1 cytochrome P450 [Hymenobacter sp. BT559]